ncbi:efflux RND transporter permease subunit, partial [Parvimonas micra]|uniref:efflux RND transporter permease subunit n=1 Tax=Parvimonas micra TaxID=33033 RepID=UPI002B4911EF
MARVIVQGGRAPEIRVNLRPGQLAALGISPGDVVASIQAANEIRTVGRLDRQFQQFQITVDGQTASIGEIKNIAVTSRAGQPIR